MCLPLVPPTFPASDRHVDAVELCFHSFLEDIERTRPRYPGERTRRSHSPQPPAHSPTSPPSAARDVRKLKMEPPLQDEDAVEYRKGERRDVEVLETGVGY